MGEKGGVIVKSTRLPFQGLQIIVCWGGATLQVTPRFAIEYTTSGFARDAEKEGITDLKALVYICSRLLGSPAFDIQGVRPIQ